MIEIRQNDRERHWCAWADRRFRRFRGRYIEVHHTKLSEWKKCYTVQFRLPSSALSKIAPLLQCPSHSDLLWGSPIIKSFKNSLDLPNGRPSDE